ncbi:MAG: SDR family oxidoreductase [Planctomycetota bacterium]|nr:SDR family oxidoreductase [Planctomycetota bacterium]
MAEIYLITGASRGIGLELARKVAARGDSVVGTVRRAEDAAAPRDAGIRVELLDVGSDDSARALARRLDGMSIDVLVNNAGRQYRVNAIEELDFAEMADTHNVNALGPARVMQALLPNLEAEGGARVIHMTSRMGCFGEYEQHGMHGYRSSKAALNMLHRNIADELKPRGITCVALHPGWVRTDMGGPEATLTVEESVASMLSVIDGVTPDDAGAIFDHTGAPLPW